MKGLLILEDGTKFEGNILGAQKESLGELVFNTGMTGYQEIVTDPSYYGQIVIMTYPMIGNYGVNDEDKQALKPMVNGFVVRECNSLFSNWRGEMDLESYLKSHDITILEGIDTRAVTKHIREKGSMIGKITTVDSMDEILEYKLDKPALQVSVKEKYTIGDGKYNIAVIDYGIKKNIIDSLLKRDFRMTVYPATVDFQTIMNGSFDGVFLSNGPGDPGELVDQIDVVKQLIGKKPVFGICLGHQIIALSQGFEIEKMKFGHRGSNHPVKDIKKDRVFITSQNHSFKLKDRDFINTDMEVTHININDESIEGLKHKKYPLFSVQYHPEASPGPGESDYLFEEFETMVIDENGGNDYE